MASCLLATDKVATKDYYSWTYENSPYFPVKWRIKEYTRTARLALALWINSLISWYLKKLICFTEHNTL